MVRKLSKVRLKVAGSTGKSWVRIFAPRFVTLMTVQARTPGWPLKKSSPSLCASCRLIVGRYPDLASLQIILIALRDFPVFPATPIVSAPHAAVHEVTRN